MSLLKKQTYLKRKKEDDATITSLSKLCPEISMTSEYRHFIPASGPGYKELVFIPSETGNCISYLGLAFTNQTFVSCH